MSNKNKPYQNKNTWIRGLYILLLLFCLGIAKFVTAFVVMFQFLNVLFTASTNQQLLKFGNSLSIYHYQVMMYVTYNSDDKPFPFSDWPDEPVAEKK